MASSRRDLLNDMAQHMPILKITSIPTTPVLLSHPKQVSNSLKLVFSFHCDILLGRGFITGYLVYGQPPTKPDPSSRKLITRRIKIFKNKVLAARALACTTHGYLDVSALLIAGDNTSFVLRRRVSNLVTKISPSE